MKINNWVHGQHNTTHIHVHVNVHVACNTQLHVHVHVQGVHLKVVFNVDVLYMYMQPGIWESLITMI